MTSAAPTGRIGCLWVPDLPLQALLRASPELAGGSIAVAEGEGARARIVAVTPRARAGGVRPGLGVGDALALVPELCVRWVEPAVVESARAATLDAAHAVSPRVEEVRLGEVLADVEGLSSLHRDERGVAAALVGAARRLGLEARVGIGAGKLVARVAAARGEGICVVPAGRERAFLAPLPVAALCGDPALAETLARWGIRTAAELAALPADGVGTRLGDAGVRLHRAARGDEHEPLSPRALPETFEEGCDLEFELDSLEGLLFLLRPALERLVARVSGLGMACGSVVVKLLLDPAGESRVPVGLAAATNDVPSLLSLCRATLEQQSPGAAVRGVRVAAVASAPRREQLRIFGLPTVAPEKLATAVAKVAAIVGGERVGSPRLVDRHEPEAHVLDRFDPPPAPDVLPTPSAPTGVAALRAFRPPLPAEVRIGHEGPQAVQADGVHGWVVSCAGPWRIDVGWHEKPLQRDAFDVELSDGAVYRLAHDLLTGTWSVVGRYD